MSLIGQHLGQYNILSLLGHGGMGEVYLAEDPRIQQQVAIKVLHVEGETIERFRDASGGHGRQLRLDRLQPLDASVEIGDIEFVDRDAGPDREDLGDGFLVDLVEQVDAGRLDLGFLRLLLGEQLLLLVAELAGLVAQHALQQAAHRDDVDAEGDRSTAEAGRGGDQLEGGLAARGVAGGVCRSRGHSRGQGLVGKDPRGASGSGGRRGPDTGDHSAYHATGDSSCHAA